jgi:stearoyl-CoA desaturase (Delta-9 desaturase)
VLFRSPLLVGALFGDPIAGLLWGGFLRVAVVHHSTFFVNSLAHRVGSQTYSTVVSARDNWGVALLTFGEGYHSFHHRFPGDFRNGTRWYYWDPAKWFIRGLQFCGLAHGLRTTAPPLIEKARLGVAAERLEERLAQVEPSRAEETKAHLARARASVSAAVELWREHLEERKQGLSDRWKETRRAYRERVRQARQEWYLARRAASDALRRRLGLRESQRLK